MNQEKERPLYQRSCVHEDAEDVAHTCQGPHLPLLGLTSGTHYRFGEGSGWGRALVVTDQETADGLGRAPRGPGFCHPQLCDLEEVTFAL